MTGWQLVIGHLPHVIVTALAAYFLGHLYLPSGAGLAGGSPARFFKKTTVGYLIAVVLYAVVRARFNTVFTGTIPLFIYFRRFLAGERDAAAAGSGWLQGISEWRRLPVLVAFSMLVGLACSYKLHLCFSGGDYLFYSGIADAFNRFGVESVGIGNAHTYASMRQATFYHYGDTAGAAWLAWMFQVPAAVAYIYIMLPFLAGLSMFGLYSWFAQRLPQWPRGLSMAVAPLVGLVAFRTLIESPKLLIVGICMIWLVLAYDPRQSVSHRALPLLFLCFFYPAVLPVTCVGLLLLAFWNRAVGRTRVPLADWAMPLGILLWFAMFYQVNKMLLPQPRAEESSSVLLASIRYLSHVPNLIGQFVLCARYTAGLGIYAAGLLAVAGVLALRRGLRSFLREHAGELLFLVFALLAGIGGVVLFPYNIERGQPIMNFFRPLADVLLALCVGAMLARRRWLAGLALLLTTLVYCSSFKNVYLLPRHGSDPASAESLAFLHERFSGRTLHACYVRNPVIQTVPASTLVNVRIPFAGIRQAASYLPECLSVIQIEPDSTVPRYNNIVPPPDYFSRSLKGMRNRSQFWRFYQAGHFTDEASAQAAHIQRRRPDVLLIEAGNPLLSMITGLPIGRTRAVYTGAGGSEVWQYVELAWKLEK